MVSRIKNKISNLHGKILPNELRGQKRKTTLFFASFYLILFSTFLTIFGQLPTFTVRNITQIFQVGWLFAIIPLFMLDYKRALRMLTISLIILLPFLFYCIIATIMKISSFSYGGTTYVLLSSYLLIVCGTFGKYKSKQSIKLISFAYVVATILYALVVFLTKLKGYDLDNQIYAFGDKNSAGPIFMFAAILSFYVFSKRNWKHIATKWFIFAFFIFIIALSKTRAVLFSIPIILFIALFYDIRKPLVFFPILIGFIFITILIFAIPRLRETIIVNILFNGKTDIDSITSGRITQIINNFQNFKPILGSGKSYFDCMILSLLCTYGVLGFITLFPFLSIPFFVLIKCRYRSKDSTFRFVALSFIVLISFSALFEGFGYIGTGAKVFIIWLFVGLYLDQAFENSKIKTVTNYFGAKYFSRVGYPSKKALLASIQAILCLASIISIIIGINKGIGNAIVDRLPSSNIIANYTEVKNTQIDPPVTSMCVGQKITYDVKSDPIDAEDKTVYWSTGWIENPCISVDGYTGEVIAKRKGTALLHINRFRVGPNGTYIQFPVVEPNEYIFDKTYISTKEFSKSFEHIENDSIKISNKCTTKVFFDNCYIPNKSLIEFRSSNTNVAIVENGLIRAVNPGICTISAVINGKETTYSLNNIEVTVEDNAFTPTLSIDLEMKDTIYQYVPYTISPIFNSDASDKNYTVSYLGAKAKVKNNQIIFEEKGTASITITSDNNPSISKAINVDIKENQPIGFECKTTRIKIGETKDFSQLGIHLVFANGYKKIVDENDISFDPFDFTNRAWSDQNGLVKNRTTIKAVVPGNIKIPLTSKIDNNIEANFNIISSVYTLDEYNYLTNGVGLLVISILSIVSIVFFVFVDAKRRIIIFVSEAGFTVLYSAIMLSIYKFNVFTMISLILLLLTLLTIVILQIVKKNRFPLLFFEDPVEIPIKNIDDYNDCSSDNSTYDIDI